MHAGGPCDVIIPSSVILDPGGGRSEAAVDSRAGNGYSPAVNRTFVGFGDRSWDHFGSVESVPGVGVPSRFPLQACVDGSLGTSLFIQVGTFRSGKGCEANLGVRNRRCHIMGLKCRVVLKAQLWE